MNLIQTTRNGQDHSVDSKGIKSDNALLLHIENMFCWFVCQQIWNGHLSSIHIITVDDFTTDHYKVITL